ncbi:MAG: histidine phosphatase family protein [Clostridia bacterium]|nr:histidine phosphatase family protein [Clostridia bacterium]
MKRIILVRHGQSEGNKRMVGGIDEDTYVNDCELNLTKLGRFQALAIANLLVEKFGTFDKQQTELWVSPFIRARQTASIINEVLDLRKVYEDPRISEHDYGNFDYQFMSKWKEISPHSYFIDKMRYKSRHAKFYARIEGGESLSDVYNRVSLFDLSRCRDNPNTQILVTHGEFIKVAIMYFTSQPIEFVYDFKEDIRNCSAYILEKDEWNSVYKYTEKLEIYRKA